jgi:hypothetical protein
MADTVFGVFSDRDNAESAINDLESAGYNAKDISIIMKDADEAQVIHDNTGASVAGGAASGATTGGIIGGITGLLIGIGAIAIPGVGAFLIGGPIAAALGLTGAAATTVSGAATGALAGGLLGALMGLGVPEEDARVYEESVKSGAILVAVPVSASSTRDAKDILSQYHADQVKSVTLRDRFTTAV